MKITQIEKYKGSQFHIYVDGSYFATVSEKVLSEYRLLEGTQCTQENLEEAVAAGQFYKARERAYYLLTYRDHSQKELAEKLRRNYPEETVEKVLVHLEELGLLNDQAYAEKLARQYLTVKNYGMRRALFEMQKKGIEAEMAQEALQEIGVNPRDQIDNLLKQKYARKLEEKNGYQKVLSALLRQGYSYEDSNDALHAYISQIEEKR